MDYEIIQCRSGFDGTYELRPILKTRLAKLDSKISRKEFRAYIGNRLQGDGVFAPRASLLSYLDQFLPSGCHLSVVANFDHDLEISDYRNGRPITIVRLVSTPLWLRNMVETLTKFDNKHVLGQWPEVDLTEENMLRKDVFLGWIDECE